MKKKINYNLSFLVILFFWCLIIFISESFYFLSLNPHNWDNSGRFIFAFFGIILGAIVDIIILAHSYEDPKKP